MKDEKESVVKSKPKSIKDIFNKIESKDKIIYQNKFDESKNTNVDNDYEIITFRAMLYCTNNNVKIFLTRN